MQHAQKRLASTAVQTVKRSTTIPLSSLRSFPPPQALAASSSKSQTFFDTESWAAIQPPPVSALTAFAHRIGLGNVLTSPDIIQQACTHQSIIPTYSKLHPNKPLPLTNANLSTMGNSLLGLFASEYIHALYPHLPTRVLKAAVSAYVGPTTCASIAKEMGAASLLRWQRTSNTPTRPAVLHADALASVARSLTALVYQQKSLLSARKFAHNFFLSRDIDLRSMIKFRDPKKALSLTVQKFGRERPVSRLLKETGRFSNSPVFVVGIYSGVDKLGEGFGSSLKMAEFRAAEDSLHRLYLTRTPLDQLRLPTSAFSSESGDLFAQVGLEAGNYVPGELGHMEVAYGSSGRSSIVLPSSRSYLEDVDED